MSLSLKALQLTFSILNWCLRNWFCFKVSEKLSPRLYDVFNKKIIYIKTEGFCVSLRRKSLLDHFLATTFSHLVTEKEQVIGQLAPLSKQVNFGP